MPTRDIACLNCGHAGMLDIHRERDISQRDLLFKHLGHNPLSGALHYRCPKCEIVLLVDPMAALGEESLKGFPGEVSDLPSRPWSDHGSVQHDLFRWFKRTQIWAQFRRELKEQYYRLGDGGSDGERKKTRSQEKRKNSDSSYYTVATAATAAVVSAAAGTTTTTHHH